MRYFKKPYWTGLAAYLSLMAVWFGFMCIVNWEYDPSRWSTGSRIILGVGAVISLRVFSIKW